MTAHNGELTVRFWGVRGTVACPGPSFMRYGGNTSCLEVRCGQQILIFDGGTGLRPLGQSLMGGTAIDADIFFTHSHVDHIVGVPFFGPLFDNRNRFRLWAGHLMPERGLRSVLCQMMAAPLFPVPIDIFSADASYHDFSAGDTLTPRPGIVIRTAPLNHPNGATGYRVDYNGRSICYVTDTEHEADRLDDKILKLIQGCDIFIYDCTYTDEEYPRFKGWGHSTWQQGMALAEAAQAKRFVIFHHDPAHDDMVMDHIAAEAEMRRPGTVVAREGMVLEA